MIAQVDETILKIQQISLQLFTFFFGFYPISPSVHVLPQVLGHWGHHFSCVYQCVVSTNNTLVNSQLLIVWDLQDFCTRACVAASSMPGGNLFLSSFHDHISGSLDHSDHFSRGLVGSCDVRNGCVIVAGIEIEYASCFQFSDEGQFVGKVNVHAVVQCTGDACSFLKERFDVENAEAVEWRRAIATFHATSTVRCWMRSFAQVHGDCYVSHREWPPLAKLAELMRSGNVEGVTSGFPTFLLEGNTDCEISGQACNHDKEEDDICMTEGISVERVVSSIFRFDHNGACPGESSLRRGRSSGEAHHEISCQACVVEMYACVLPSDATFDCFLNSLYTHRIHKDNVLRDFEMCKSNTTINSISSDSGTVLAYVSRISS